MDLILSRENAQKSTVVSSELRESRPSALLLSQPPFLRGFSSKLDPSVYELFVYTSMASTLRSVRSFANLLVDILVLVT